MLSTSDGLCLFYFVFIYITEMQEFQKIVGTFISLVDSVAKEVEKEKMKVQTCQIMLYMHRF